MGRKAQAIAENKRAVEIDPLSLPINNFMAMTYVFAGDDGSAYRQFQHTIAIDPLFPLAHGYSSWFLSTIGRYEEAIKEQEKIEVLGGSSPEEAATRATALERAFKKAGAKGFWQAQLERQLQAGTYPSPVQLARSYAPAGQTDKAFRWLQKAYEERDGQELTLLKFDPAYKNLRTDPRFSALLQKMGLPQ
jgi:adenylate cyclase